MEPAAVLVGALQVEVGRPGEFVGMAAAHHGVVRDSGVEPHVENVGGADVVGGLVGSEEVLGFGGGPGFDALFLDHLRDLFHDLKGARVQLARFLVHEEGERNAPVALTGDAPVGTVLDHRVEAVDAPGREELRGLDAFEGGIAKGSFARLCVEHAARVGVRSVHADEPLVRGAVDERGLVAPAVHVAVHERAVGEQVACNGDRLADLVGRSPDVEAAEERKRLGVGAVAHHGGEDLVVRHAVLLAGDEVVHAVGGSGVHDARTGRRVDVVGEIDGREAAEALVDVPERMTEAHELELVAHGGSDLLALHAVALKRGFGEARAEDEKAVAHVVEPVFELGVHVQGLVGGNRPGRRRPDDVEAGLFKAAAEDFLDACAVLVGELEGDVDRVALLVLVLDFGFGQGGLAVEAPVHGLEAAVDIALFHDGGKGADFLGLVLELHRAVGVVPVAENAEALEVGELELALLEGVGTGKALHLVDGEVLAVHLLDLHFDRHAVAVPARNVRGLEALKGLFLEDHVLEDLVDGVTDVDVAVGVGRTVMKDELLGVAAGVDDAFVDVLFIPLPDPFRFALGQVAAHRERRVGKVERVFLGVGGRSGFFCHGQYSWPPRALQVKVKDSCLEGGRPPEDGRTRESDGHDRRRTRWRPSARR